MAANTKSIIFKITEAGKDAALQESGEGAQIKVDLTQVALGTGKYNLPAVRYRWQTRWASAKVSCQAMLSESVTPYVLAPI